jgi:hypothetical protein
MAIFASDTGGNDDFKMVPEGTHFAICDMMVDLGKQETKSVMFGDSVKHQVYIRWQIPAERVEYEKDGQTIDAPMAIGKTYTLSLSEKANLRKDLQAWRGKAFTGEELQQFDISSVLGVPATITVTHGQKQDGGTYAKIASVGGIPKGMTAPALEGELLLYDADTMTNFEKLRPWLQDKIRASVVEEPKPEPQRPLVGADSDLDDDCPF